MSRFLDKRLQNLEKYTPGEQPKNTGLIKLNTNESPFAPAPEIMNIINSSEAEKLRLYPDPDTKELSEAIAGFLGVKSENICTGNGSDDMLNFAFMAFCGTEKGVAFPEISYGFYQVYADLYNLNVKKIPLKDDFTIDCRDYFGLSRTIFIANPNAPTGIALSVDEIERILIENEDVVVVIDEAYVDFGAESAVKLTKKYDNLLVVQTMSKSRSLAGARLGYAVGNKELIDDLKLIKFSTNPYSINRLSSKCGVASMLDVKYFEDCCNEIIKTREFLLDNLTKRGFFTLISSANFVFTKHRDRRGSEMYDILRDNGILVRRFEKKGIEDFLRITIGSQSEMEELLRVLDKMEENNAKNS